MSYYQPAGNQTIPMKNRCILLYILILLPCMATLAQTNQSRWSYNSASTLPHGSWESGIVQPFRYGITDRLEVGGNVLLFPLLPNAGVRFGFGDKRGILLASEHVVSIPSVFLNTVSRKGTGGMISPEFEFPFMISFRNSLIATRFLNERTSVNLKAGFSFTLKNGSVDPLATIDLPVFYPRMAHYYKGISLNLAGSVSGQLSSHWFYEEGLNAFYITRNRDNFFSENRGCLIWKTSRSLRIKGGYVLSYGCFPFGRYWQLWPSVDLVFGSRR